MHILKMFLISKSATHYLKLPLFVGKVICGEVTKVKQI